MHSLDFWLNQLHYIWWKTLYELNKFQFCIVLFIKSYLYSNTMSSCNIYNKTLWTLSSRKQFLCLLHYFCSDWYFICIRINYRHFRTFKKVSYQYFFPLWQSKFESLTSNPCYRKNLALFFYHCLFLLLIAEISRIFR